MEKKFMKKITWVIKNFSSLQSVNIFSDYFIVDGCKWHLLAYPKATKNDDYMSLYLEVANYETLPSGWKRHAKVSFTIVNQISEKLSRQSDFQHWFNHTSPNWGFPSIFPLKELHAKDSGFLVNGELKIVAMIDVLEVIGKLDVSEETSTIIETIDVNGFQLLPSQVKYVSRMFERHSDIASEFRPKNPNLRTAYMSFLISLIETMCQTHQELSKDDLSEVYAALESMTNAGFKLDWLEKKLDEISEKKEKENIGETWIQDMEEELKNLKLKCSDMEALVEKEKKQVLPAKSPLSFDDVV